MNARVIFSTAPSEEIAREISESLVTERLVACVNISPSITSIYRWEGKIQKDKEALMIMKTTASGLEKLKARFLELHPYDTPEFICLTPEMVEDRYLQWIDDSVST